MITYSFIIPHHNTPELLQRLVNSIPQREDIEIIVVDDNSDNDKKANIIRSDVQIIYIDKEHTKGAGRARNVGMDAATGKWLLFADADDFYKPGFIDVLDEYRNDNIEILFFNIDCVDSDTLERGEKDRAMYHNRLIEQYDGTEQRANELLFFGYGPWRKMLSSSFVKRYGFRYEEIVVSNDSFFSLQTSYFVKKYKVDKRKLYVLTFKQGSITFSKVTKAKYSTILNIYRRRAKLFEYMGHSEWNRKSCRGLRSQSCIKYIYKLLKTKNPSVAFRTFVYYITHYFEIERNSFYYVKIIKNIEKRVGNGC